MVKNLKALMIPIVLSVLDQLHESGIGENSKDDSISIAIENDAFDESLEKTQDIEKPEKPENIETTTETEFTDLTNQAEENENRETENSTENDDNSSFKAESEPEIRRSALDIGLLLSVPFAASIGGTGTFTGTDLNLYLAGFYKDYYSNTSGENFQGKFFRICQGALFDLLYNLGKKKLGGQKKSGFLIFRLLFYCY